MPAEIYPGPVVKTRFLNVLERVGNTATKQELLQIRTLLESGMSLIDIFRSLPEGQQDGVGENEVAHVGQDWFDPKTGWWTRENPEQVMREGLIRSIELSLEYGEPGEYGKPFPVDYWWVQDAGQFRFISKISPQQQTVFLLTPSEPRPDAARVRAPARAKARKAVKKAPKKAAKRAPKKAAKRAPKKAAKKVAKKAKRR